MVVVYRATAHEVGETFATLVRRHEAAQQLWVATNRDTIELWLLTHSLEAGAEPPFYEAAAALYDRFPEAFIRFHLVNPRLFGPDTDTETLLHHISADADEIPLHSA